MLNIKFKKMSSLDTTTIIASLDTLIMAIRQLINVLENQKVTDTESNLVRVTVMAEHGLQSDVSVNDVDHDALDHGISPNDDILKYTSQKWYDNICKCIEESHEQLDDDPYVRQYKNYRMIYGTLCVIYRNEYKFNASSIEYGLGRAMKLLTKIVIDATMIDCRKLLQSDMTPEVMVKGVFDAFEMLDISLKCIHLDGIRYNYKLCGIPYCYAVQCMRIFKDISDANDIKYKVATWIYTNIVIKILEIHCRGFNYRHYMQPYVSMLYIEQIYTMMEKYIVVLPRLLPSIVIEEHTDIESDIY